MIFVNDLPSKRGPKFLSLSMRALRAEKNTISNWLSVHSFNHVNHGEEASLACEVETRLWVVAWSEKEKLTLNQVVHSHAWEMDRLVVCTCRREHPSSRGCLLRSMHSQVYVWTEWPRTTLIFSMMWIPWFPCFFCYKYSTYKKGDAFFMN